MRVRLKRLNNLLLIPWFPVFNTTFYFRQPNLHRYATILFHHQHCLSHQVEFRELDPRIFTIYLLRDKPLINFLTNTCLLLIMYYIVVMTNCNTLEAKNFARFFNSNKRVFMDNNMIAQAFFMCCRMV